MTILPIWARYRALSWILLLGLTLRLGAAFAASDAPPVGDAGQYAAIARNIAERGEFAYEPGRSTAMRPPLYPAFLAVFARACPGTWSCARAAQAMLDASTILLIYSFGLGAFGRAREALAGAFLYAVHPVFIAYTTHLLTETLFLWLWMASLCLLAKAVETGSSPRVAAAAGAAMGLATLCRPAFMFFPFGAAAILFAFGRDRARLFPRLALLLTACWLTTVPWTVRNRIMLGAWGPIATGGGAALWSGAQALPTSEIPDQVNALQAELAAGRGEFEADARIFKLAEADYRSNASAILKQVPRRLAGFWLTSHSAMFGLDESLAAYRAQGRWGAIAARAALWAFQLAILSLGVLGLWQTRSAWTTECTLAAAAVGYFSLHILTGYWTNRYHLPALAVLMVFAAAALLRASDRSFRWR
jgi:4-amino-4-deoxy-L-arabinose transferase-like glycosyltransferase